jgi:kynurenine formamidase
MVPGDPTIGVNRWADRGIAGRGVLIDVAAYRERLGRPLDHPNSEQIGVDLLAETLAAQGTVLEPGDMLLVRTDYPRYFWAHPAPLLPQAGLAQREETIAWLWDHQIPVIAADNLAVEAIATAAREATAVSLHNALIPLLGMVVGELWRLDDLAADCAADGRYEFMLVLKPLNLVGGVASPPNATAIK